MPERDRKRALFKIMLTALEQMDDTEVGWISAMCIELIKARFDGKIPDPERLPPAPIKASERPWRVERVLSDGWVDICADDVPGEGSPNVIAIVLYDEDDEDERRIAEVNAAHIVRCVNAIGELYA